MLTRNLIQDLIDASYRLGEMDTVDKSLPWWVDDAVVQAFRATLVAQRKKVTDLHVQLLNELEKF